MHIPFIAPSPFSQNRVKCLMMSIHKLHRFFYCINHFPLYKFSLSWFFCSYTYCTSILLSVLLYTERRDIKKNKSNTLRHMITFRLDKTYSKASCAFHRQGDLESLLNPCLGSRCLLLLVAENLKIKIRPNLLRVSD